MHLDVYKDDNLRSFDEWRPGDWLGPAVIKWQRRLSGEEDLEIAKTCFDPEELQSGTVAVGAGMPGAELHQEFHPAALRCLVRWWKGDCGVFLQTLKDLVTGKSLLWRAVGAIHGRLCCSLVVRPQNLACSCLYFSLT